MSRRRQATKRPVTRDGKFQSFLVSCLANTIMKGVNKRTAHSVVSGTIEQLDSLLLRAMMDRRGDE